MASRTGAAIVAGLLAGCGPGKPAETDGGSTSMGSSGETSGETSGPTSGGSVPPTTSGMTSTGGTGSTGESLPPCHGDKSAGPATCAAFDDRASCNAAPLDPAVGECIWVAWFPVRLVDDTCTFGDPRGVCQFVGCSLDGCPAHSPCGKSGPGGAFVVGMNEQVSVAKGAWCNGPEPPAMPCEVDAQGQVLAGAPECACLCDPGFPGAL